MNHNKLLITLCLLAIVALTIGCHETTRDRHYRYDSDHYYDGEPFGDWCSHPTLEPYYLYDPQLYYEGPYHDKFYGVYFYYDPYCDEYFYYNTYYAGFFFYEYNGWDDPE